ncbi:aspartate/methionine/tyrosine aminotransferase [Tamaricihabitans halophyticus]|uniref:Aspartate/methionine/tyrosine aminotransferase n=1 Tax=Tamaricihabitans halophyticus TaxID=1262583 RepID=A0A4R2QFZ3_9PSEU|nr:pyridoxal phosphate-dependent aminotransferase [Tamaricihabitans halophyticus]TCP47248.1 aspartate/methionine/tyrosine aminotransferase [Tamaricihabitans halophyticus]
MTVDRVRAIPGIGVNLVGDRADATDDAELLRLENLDTDLRPPAVALAATHAAIDADHANSYLPFQGHRGLRAAAAAHVSRISGTELDPETQCVSVAGGLNGVLNALLATVSPGQEVVLAEPIYAGLINRVHLAGGIPRYVRVEPSTAGWQLDPDQLAAAVGPQTAAVLLMGPAMPTGAVLTREHLDALAKAVRGTDCWIIYDAAMERLRFDGQPPLHPATHPGLAGRTITVGSASKELRMIGWRVGWITGPQGIMADIATVGMANVVCQVGIAQDAVAAALDAPDADADVRAATEIWRQRCETILRQLASYPVVPPAGGWSLLVDTTELAPSAAEAAERLFELGRVAATPMAHWGPSAEKYVRLVFANEPEGRLTDLGARFDAAFGG